MLETIESPRLLLPLAITFLAPFAVWKLGADPNRREGASFAGGFLAFACTLWLAPAVLAGKVWTWTLFTLLPGVTVSFCADGLSLIFALVACFLWMFATSYNIGYMRSLNEHAQTRYYFCFAVAIFGAVGVAFSANVFTLYLFYELITVFTYPLVAHHQDEEGFSGARKYMVYLMGSSKLFLLPAMVLTYVLAGTLDFNLSDAVHGMFPPDADPVLVRVTYFLYLFGLAKAAIMPLHNWLPGAMVAPTPVSALLHAVAVVKAGVFSLARVILSGFGVETMDVLGMGMITAYLAAFTLVTASVIALTKDNLKARLAYSTVSQLSYVILGISLLTAECVQGGVIHIANHAFSKITLFFCAGAIYVASNKKAISELGGLGRSMPFTFGAFAVASLSMIGVPPVAGFVSKWMLLEGSMRMATPPSGILVALLASTVLNVAYFAPITYTAFFGKPVSEESQAGLREAPLSMVVPLVLTALISVFIGLFPDVFLSFAKVVTG